jgi:hypothetical protein
MPYPHDRGPMSLDAYLLRLLAAIVIDNGGELRIKAQTVLNLEGTPALIRTRDKKRDEIVLRFGLPDTETYFIPDSNSPKSQDTQSWPKSPMTSSNTQPLSPATRSSVPQNLDELRSWLSNAADSNPEGHSRHVVLDDLSQFLQEQRRQQMLTERHEAEERSQQFREGERPYRNFPSGTPPPRTRRQ